MWVCPMAVCSFAAYNGAFSASAYKGLPCYRPIAYCMRPIAFALLVTVCGALLVAVCVALLDTVCGALLLTLCRPYCFRPIGYCMRRPIGYCMRHPVGYCMCCPIGYCILHCTFMAAVSCSKWGKARCINSQKSILRGCSTAPVCSTAAVRLPCRASYR